MDFTLTDDQAAIAELAGRILADKLPPERLTELEEAGDGFPADVWAELARADLLGLCLPAADGGGGYGMVEAALILEEIGRTVAPVPFLPTIVLGAMAIAEHGTPEQRARWLPGVISGDALLTVAVAEEGGATVPDASPVAAVADGAGWRLDGQRAFVPVADRAGVVLVPARTGERRSGVFLVDPRGAGVGLEAQVTTTGEVQWLMTLDGAVAHDALGDPDDGGPIVAGLVDRAVAGSCAIQAGVCEAALRLTASYTSERHQFGAPIATFQAVAQRAADAYIDTEAVRLTARQAAWRVAAGVPAAEALSIAKFWAAEGGQRVVHAAQHLHGGIGVDVDYPLHRYFRWAKQYELAFGGASAHLRRLGARLAAAPM
ncbi:acyl-CoA dehydrogenase family protein [soil metagenome]